MIEIDETYVVLAVVMFFSAFLGNILAYHIREWYEDRMFYKAFNPFWDRKEGK